MHEACNRDATNDVRRLPTPAMGGRNDMDLTHYRSVEIFREDKDQITVFLVTMW